MVALERTVQVQAFHYIPADALDLEKSPEPAYVQWDRLEKEIPGFDIYDVVVQAEEVTDLFEDEEGAPILTIVQRWYENGERSNIAHTLRPEDWLVQDLTAEGNYRVLTPAQLHKFLKGSL